MKPENVRMFLETMLEYHTVKINQVFDAEDGQSLAIRCVPGTMIFEITHPRTNEIIQSDSIDETTAYIVAFLTANRISESS